MHPRNYANIERRRYVQRQSGAQSFAGLEVMLHLDSFCLGDTLCWASLIPAFLAHHKPSRLIVTTFWPELFQSTESTVFVDAVGEGIITCDVFLSAGYNKHSLAHTTHGMFYAARESLRLPQDAQPSRAPFTRYEYQRQPNKIVIAPESTKSIARWDYRGIDIYGWQDVVDRFNLRGFEVHDISYEHTLMLRGVHKHGGNADVRAAIQHLCEARLFVGLSSGLAWLAWAYETPVVMISGFTKFFNEFPCYRVWNPHACTGCFNVLMNIASPCPLFQNTPRQHECHRTITPEMVMAQVNRALVDTSPGNS
jgi:autotransporter strand-loop-strand O-heptosyltransferase